MSAAGLEAENSLNSVTWSTERRDAPGIVRLLGHLGLIAFATVVTSQAQGLLYWPAAFVQGVLMVFLFCALQSRTTAFKSRWINAVVCDAVGFMLCLPPRWFAAFIWRTTAIPRTPTAILKWQCRNRPAFAVHLVVSGAVYWWFALSGLVRRALGQTGAAYYDERAALSPRPECISFFTLSLPPFRSRPAVRLRYLLDHTASSRSAGHATLSVGGALGMPVRAEHVGEHTDDAHLGASALHRLEHAFPCGTSR